MDSCIWPVKFSACKDATESGCDHLNELDAEARQSFERRASALLWEWSGRIFGECPETLRPCLTDCAGMRPSTYEGLGPRTTGSSAPTFIPAALSNGTIGTIWCGDCGNNVCNCSGGVRSLALPAPVIAITQVTLDGEVLPEADYALMYGRYLVRRGGKEWPRCQDLMAPSTEPGTFEVQYTRGIPVPEGGQIAAGILACELAKNACGDSTCRLPERVTTITRQGVTIGFEDKFDLLEDGRVGIWEIDAWLSSVAPRHTISTIGSVDRRRNV